MSLENQTDKELKRIIKDSFSYKNKYKGDDEIDHLISLKAINKTIMQYFLGYKIDNCYHCNTYNAIHTAPKSRKCNRCGILYHIK